MERIDVVHEDGDRYAVTIRDHTFEVDQPDSGDAAPTPTELFVASLASCVAFYAGRFCARHGVDATGLGVTCEWAFAEDRPARVARIDVRVTTPPGFPEQKRPRLQAVVDHCTVHTSIVMPPEITIAVEAPATV
jgi:putative redox protein